MVAVYWIVDGEGGDPVYVGQTRQTPRRRFQSHMQYARTTPHLPRSAWLLSATDPRLVVVWDDLDQEPADAIEDTEIDHLRSIGFRLFNIARGGISGPGRMTPNFTGQTHIPELKQHWSEVRSGTMLAEDNPFYGKNHTDEQRESWSASRGTGIEIVLPDGTVLDFKSLNVASHTLGVCSKTLSKYLDSGIPITVKSGRAGKMDGYEAIRDGDARRGGRQSVIIVTPTGERLSFSTQSAAMKHFGIDGTTLTRMLDKTPHKARSPIAGSIVRRTS